MTVINTNYSTLEEAWGGNFNKTKKKKAKDPLCELYSKKNIKARKPFYDESNEPQPMDDSVYGSILPGNYEKSRSSRTMRIQKDASDRQRKPNYKTVEIDGADEPVYAAEDEDDDDVYLEKYLDQETREDSGREPPERYAKYSRFADDKPVRRRGSSALYVDYDAAMDKDKMIDLGLYIVSGVLMIFTMEQILQLGMRMK